MIILLAPENASDKILNPFIFKAIERSGFQGTYLNIINAIYSKPVFNIKLNQEKFNSNPLKSGTRQGL